jgi:tetratricopeptide (TPR) repeat protein
MRRFMFVLLVVCAGFCPWTRIAAQAPGGTKETDEPPGYKAAVEVAISEFDQGNFAEAKAQFQRAHALSPSARTLRGIGMSDFELRDYVSAIDNLKEALRSHERRLEGPLRQQTLELLQRAESYVGTVHLHVDPPSAVVVLDGFGVRTPPDGLMRLGVGEHTIEVRASQHVTERRALKVSGQETIELTVALAPVSSTNPGSLAHDERTPVYKRWWLWTTVGVVAAAGAVTAAILLTRDKGRDNEPLTTANTPPDGTFQPLLRFR